MSELSFCNITLTTSPSPGSPPPMTEASLAAVLPPVPGIRVPWYRLSDTRDGMGRYIRRAWLIGLIPSLLIATALEAAGLLTDQTGLDMLRRMPAGEMLLAVLVFAPVVETLLLALTLFILRRFIRRPLGQAAAAAGIWGLLHLSNGPMSPLIIAWPFFVFSVAYQAWRPRGWLRAFTVVTAIHFLQNLLPALLLLVLPDSAPVEVYHEVY